MAGSLQARAQWEPRTEGLDVEPDVCPQPGHGAVTLRRCMTTDYNGRERMCPYLYGVTQATDPGERLDAAEVKRWMIANASRTRRVRVLCLAAKPVDRAGA